MTINSSLETVQCWRQYVIRQTIPHVNSTKAEEMCCQFCPAVSFLVRTQAIHAGFDIGMKNAISWCS